MSATIGNNGDAYPDSEAYDGNNEESPSSSSPSSSSSPLMLYSPPTVWSLIRGAAINLVLPFINGLMLGFGELLAHEAAFRLGWGGTRVCQAVPSFHLPLLTTLKVFPAHRNSRSIGPGVQMTENVIERKRRSGEELDAYTSLE